MELQLGLALPTHGPIKGFGFDLNCNGFEPEEMVSTRHIRKKRSFDVAFDHGGVPTQTLPLLSWNDQPNEEDDHQGLNKRTSIITNQDDEENHIVGWPPIKSWRKKLLHGHQDGRIGNDPTAERGSGRTNSTYVKVKMEGVAIGRKINLRLYRSYQTLTNTLITMFAKYQKIEKDGARFTILYQDNEGDWLLAGDVPWQTFTETVQRLEILRSAG